MAIEFLDTPGDDLMRSLMAYAYPDDGGRMPDDVPTVKRVDAPTLQAFFNMFTQGDGEQEDGIRRAAAAQTRERIGALYVPEVLRERFGIDAEILIDMALDLRAAKTRSLLAHEMRHRRQDLEGTWLGLGHEGREREAGDTERLFFSDYYERLR